MQTLSPTPDPLFLPCAVAVFASILGLVGSLSPWMQVAGLQQNGTDIGSFRWGFLSLLLSASGIALAVIAYVRADRRILTYLTYVGALLAAFPLGMFAYYLWFCSFSVFDYGVYLLLVSAVAIIAVPFFSGVSGDRRFIVASAALCGLALALSSLAGLRHPMTDGPKMSRTMPETLSELYGGMGPSTGSPSPAQGWPGWPWPAAQGEMDVSVKGYWEATALGVGYAAETAGAGQKYLIVSLSAKNVGEEEEYLSDGDFVLEGSDRVVYSVNPFASYPGVNSISARLLPGGVASGDVVFEVPRSVRPVKVRYEPSWF